MDDSGSGKVRKSVALSEKEKIRLLELLRNNKETIFDKNIKADAIKRKRKVWDEIVDDLNSNSEIKRTAEQLKKSWKNLALKSRGHLANWKKEHMKTGGGENSIVLSQIDSIVLSIYTEENPVIAGAETGFDSMLSPFDPLEKLDKDLLDQSKLCEFDETEECRPSSSASSASIGETQAKKRSAAGNSMDILRREILQLEKTKVEAQIEYFRTLTAKAQLEISKMLKDDPDLTPVVVAERSF